MGTFFQALAVLVFLLAGFNFATGYYGGGACLVIIAYLSMRYGDWLNK